MTDRVQKHVLDYLLNALDDSEMEAVKTRLESDPVYRRAMFFARGNMARFDSLVRMGGMRRGIAPPQRLAERTCVFLFDPARRLRSSSALRPRSTTPPPRASRSPTRLNWADLGVVAAIFLIAGFLVLPAIHGARFAIMADLPSANRPNPIANQGELEQNVLFEELRAKSCSTARLVTDDIDSKDNHEVAPALYRDADVTASNGTATVVCISMP